MILRTPGPAGKFWKTTPAESRNAAPPASRNGTKDKTIIHQEEKNGYLLFLQIDIFIRK